LHFTLDHFRKSQKMCSPFAGCWKLYGRENAEVLADMLHLPSQFKLAMSRVRICEEINVCGDNVHVNVMVPSYTVPAHSKEINFAFGVEHCQSLPFGRTGKGTVQKESETKWVFNFTHEDGNGSVTRELRNDEMWVHVETKGVKAIRKFERCNSSKAGECPSAKAGASPFQGCWKLYGSDNFDKFMEVVGVPLHWRCVFANMTVMESIHVNGNDVHVKICLPDVVVNCHNHEISGKFNEPHEVSLPFGQRGTVAMQKISETKWQGKVTGCCALGECSITREIHGKEMWVTIDVKGKHVVQKFHHCGPCGSQDACTTRPTSAACNTGSGCQ